MEAPVHALPARRQSIRSWRMLAAALAITGVGAALFQFGFATRTELSSPSLSMRGQTRTSFAPVNWANSPVTPRYTRVGAKTLHFNNNDYQALRQMLAGVEKLAAVVGVTLGPKGRNVVLESGYGTPSIVNDGVTIAKQVDLEDPLENMGCKLVREASTRTNDIAGDGTTTAIILSHAMISEGMKVVSSGVNPVQIVRGMEKTGRLLVEHLKELSNDVSDDQIGEVATISAGGNREIGDMIFGAYKEVGRQGVITLEEGKSTENSLRVIEGMQFDRGYISPYFVTDTERMSCVYQGARLLLVDKKITNAREMIGILEETVKGGWPLLIIAEDIDQEVLSTLVLNKLRGGLKVCAIKAPGFGERKSSYLEDIAILTGGQVIKDEVGLTLDKATVDTLGKTESIMVAKEVTTIVGDGSTTEEVNARIKQIEKLMTDEKAKGTGASSYELDKLNERIARLAGGVAVVEVGATTESELKEKKLRVEDALCATKSAVEEGIVAGGGTTLLKLAAKVSEIKGQLDNEEQRMGADIIERALKWPLRLIASNAGETGDVVINNVLQGQKQDTDYGWNAANGEYGNMLTMGVIDPTKVIRSCIENGVSVAKTFLTSDAVVAEKPEEKEDEGMPAMGY
eukprot:CAMPEP_0167803472 /NCGR_PEP_ID=MMETSP0111_2-20121227/19854_1 /TAXON_ID=91324 /ORGANISM="Lotharella globosa, Strain CCCM811" /LENGTH=627 /DNA_ID=CAMNT_0007699943 /DNA_START=1084 /DNA_END=2967 /DNA_ORIENTATION=+